MAGTKNLRFLDNDELNKTYPTFSKALRKIKPVSLDKFIDEHGLYVFKKVDEPLTHTVKDIVGEYKDNVLPRSATCFLTGMENNLSFRLSAELTTFMEKRTKLMSVEKGITDLIDKDKLFTDLLARDLITVEIVQLRNDVLKQTTYGFLLSQNINPIIEVNDLNTIVATLEDLQNSGDNDTFTQGYRELFTPELTAKLAHDIKLLLGDVSNGVGTFLDFPELASSHVSEERSQGALRKILLGGLGNSLFVDNYNKFLVGLFDTSTKDKE